MPRKMLAISALAAALAGGALFSANAAPLGNPAALAGAAEENGVLDIVHCRSGWRHHDSSRWRRGDGCSRGGAVVVVPGRTRYIMRDGVRVRVGIGNEGGERSRTTIRSRSTTTRSGSDGDSRSSTTIRSGREGGNATTGAGSRQDSGRQDSGRRGQPSTQQSPSGGGSSGQSGTQSPSRGSGSGSGAGGGSGSGNQQQ